MVLLRYGDERSKMKQKVCANNVYWRCAYSYLGCARFITANSARSFIKCEFVDKVEFLQTIDCGTKYPLALAIAYLPNTQGRHISQTDYETSIIFNVNIIISSSHLGDWRHGKTRRIVYHD